MSKLKLLLGELILLSKRWSKNLESQAESTFTTSRIFHISWIISKTNFIMKWSVIVLVLFKLSLCSTENKFVTTYATSNVRNSGSGDPALPLKPQWTHPLIASGIAPSLGTNVVSTNETSVPTVKIVENYSVTNVERIQVRLVIFTTILLSLGNPAHANLLFVRYIV